MMTCLAFRKGAWLVGLGLVLTSYGVAVHADIYGYVDKHGVRHLTTKPNDARYRLLSRTRIHGPAGGTARPTRGVRPRQFDATVRGVAGQLGLDPRLVHAVIQAESGYDPRAVSHKGAVGLMQLMPATAQRYGVRDRHDPEANVRGGSRFLKDLLHEFDDLKLALAAYNAGAQAVRSHGNRIPPYPETRTFVERVLRFYRSQGAAP
jgi:soluble lytic murein transglycosylase-like protein